jgi:small redox-active disulfide protein 2
MKIQVLGPGCMKCNKLYEEAQKAIGLAGVEAELEKVDKIDQIMKFGVAITPALIIDGQLKASGKVPKADQIASWLKEIE